jgi:uncharacterized membrane protein YhaH (DUF805 family)
MQPKDTDTVRIVCGLLAAFVFLPLLLLPYWKIFSRAGFSGWWALSIVVPLLNIVALYYVAFSRWKTVDKSPLAQNRFCPHCGNALAP